jgi:ABC-type lipoprotein release transport system permease subunit
MTLTRLALDSLRFYRRTHTAVALGVASAVAVLSGALLVGYSVRASLVALTAGRLGTTRIVVSADHPFTGALGDRLGSALEQAASGSHPRVAPLFTLTGVAQHESSGRRANNVLVYGVDERFFAFHGVTTAAPAGSDVWLSPDLAAEVGAMSGDSIVIRVAKPTDIPIDSLHGRREEAGQSLRLTGRGTIGRDGMGEFSLAPAQGPVRAAFVSLARLQKDLGQAGRVNLLLLSGAPEGAAGPKAVRDALPSALTGEDLGLRVEVLGTRSGMEAGSSDPASLLVEATGGLIADATATAIEAAATRESLTATPVFTWLANRLTVSGRTTPYSLVTAIGPDAAGDTTLAGWLTAGSPTPIVLNEWAARDLHAAPGSALELEYYRWADEGRLVTDRAAFRVAGVLPMRGLALDRRLAPPYPGITSARGLADWDPPFPIDLKLVRPVDEAYWDQFRTAPKAFIPLAAGQSLWGTRYGRLTSVRLRAARAGIDLTAAAGRMAVAIPRGVAPASAGLKVVDVRSQNLESSSGATDFGAYFSYFSAFLMISALLLAALFFRLSIEQRLEQIGVLRATGYPLQTIRNLWLIEGSVVAVAGAAFGMLLAIGWAAFMMHGLGTWWIGAVGTSRLQLHINWASLVPGAIGGALAAVAAIALTVRHLSRQTPRELLTGSRDAPAARRAPRRAWLAGGALASAIALSVFSALGVVPSSGGFFGAGTLVLAGGLAAFAHRLARPTATSIAGRGTGGLVRLGLRNASWRPGRSLTSAGLVAAAVFLIVSVDAFRKGDAAPSGPASGTGGFALFAESALPIVDDPSTPAGRGALGLQTGPSDASLAGVEIFPLRLRPGDDASCLNLYQPKQPRVLGVPERLIEAGRFRFSRTLAVTDAERDNPWRLLGPADAEGVVPAIVDATSLEYIFHSAVGDVITIDTATPQPVRVRLVAALEDSVLQGEVLVSERAFLALYPRLAGYRVLLVGVTPATPTRTAEVTKLLEQRLDAFGLDAQATATRLEAFHRVENTYLSTFQTLGGLGLVLGTFGLVAVIARNVFERRRELALLGASGYSGRDLQIVVAAEHLALVAAGLVVGAAAALVAILPILVSHGGELPYLSFLWLAGVAATGAVTAFLATRRVRRLPLVASLRSE